MADRTSSCVVLIPEARAREIASECPLTWRQVVGVIARVQLPPGPAMDFHWRRMMTTPIANLADWCWNEWLGIPDHADELADCPMCGLIACVCDEVPSGGGVDDP